MTQRVEKRLNALQATVQQLAEVQPSLLPCLELTPCVGEVGIVGQLLRANHRKTKGLRAGYATLKEDYEALEAEVARLERPEEEDKQTKYMLQKSAFRLNKADLRSKRSEKRLRHLKQRLLSYARTDLSNIQSSYLHELSSLQTYFQRQCTSFQSLRPHPIEIKPFFSEMWPSVHSDDLSALVSTGKDWIVEELSLIVSAAFVELSGEFDHHMRSFAATADYELEELHRELAQLRQLASTKGPSRGPIVKPYQVQEYAQYTDYLAVALEKLNKVTGELESQTHSALQPQLDEVEPGEAELFALRRHLDELQETVQGLEDQSNQYFDEQEDDATPLASKLNTAVVQLGRKVQTLQNQLLEARPGRQSLEVQSKQADQLYVVSLEDFPQRAPLPASVRPGAPALYEDQ